MKTTSIFLVAAATLLWSAVDSPDAVAGGGSDEITDAIRIVDPDAKFFGRTYSDLVGDWWNWAFQGPIETNPIIDPDGTFCDVGQQGKFWFLAGAFGPFKDVGPITRDCTVPGGKALFFPLVNILFWTPDDATTLEEARAGSNSQIDPTSFLLCEIDGVPVSDLFAYRAQTFPGGFVFEIPEGSFLTQVPGCAGELPCEPGPRPFSVADGYWIGLRPLPAGPHTIHFEGAVGEDPILFELNVTYFLTVGGDDGEAIASGAGQTTD